MQYTGVIRLRDEVSQVKGAHTALRSVGGLTCAGMSTLPRACPERKAIHLGTRLGVCLGGVLRVAKHS